jgi:hypothetical protein
MTFQEFIASRQEQGLDCAALAAMEAAWDAALCAAQAAKWEDRKMLDDVHRWSDRISALMSWNTQPPASSTPQ